MNSMNKFWLIAISFLIYQFSFSSVAAQTIPSPDGKINMVMELTADGQPQYRVLYEGQEVVKRSPLGLVTNMGDFSSGLVLKDVVQTEISEPYELRNIKKSNVNYEATEAVFIYALKDKPETTVMEITFRVSNLDVAFRYKLYPKRDTRVCVVEKERSAVILSELFPDNIWLATVYPMNFSVFSFQPLCGHSVTLFPPTDETMDSYLYWMEVADQARRQYRLHISVSNVLELHATPEQKRRKIDLVDFLFEASKDGV